MGFLERPANQSVKKIDYADVPDKTKDTATNVK